MIRYHYFGLTFAITEVDGVRVIAQDVCDLIQKVPGTSTSYLWRSLSNCRVASSLSIFRPGSTSPSAILYDAWESFTKKSPKADENIRSIKPELATAVNECIDAAGQEWEPYWQRRLLNVCAPFLKPEVLALNIFRNIGREIRPGVPRFS